MKNIIALIFAKYPQPGSVKTRMVPPLTAKQASTLHLVCLRAVCERISAVKELETILVVTPDDQFESFRSILPDCAGDYWTQGTGDLGERLIRTVDRAFSEKADAVILLGADSPTLPIDFLQQAVERVSDHDAVLGPCDDGGYYLLALSKPLPKLFDDIDWGSDNVADQTRERATAANIDLSELETWYDLDRVEDLVRAQRDLQATTQDQQPAAYALKTYIDELLLCVEA